MTAKRSVYQRRWADEVAPFKPRTVPGRKHEPVSDRNWGVFLRHVYEGETYAQIAQRLGTSTVRVRSIVKGIDWRLRYDRGEITE